MKSKLSKIAVAAAFVFSMNAIVQSAWAGGRAEDLPTPRQGKGSVCEQNPNMAGCNGNLPNNWGGGSVGYDPTGSGAGGGGTVTFCLFSGQCYIVRMPKAY